MTEAQQLEHPTQEAQPPAPLARETRSPMNLVRRAGAVILAAAAIVVWFALAPSTSPGATDSSQTSSAAIDAALASDLANQASTSTAPQQAVANGWVARDLLEVIARQGAVAAPETDQRPTALLGLAVLGIALILFTSGSPGRRVKAVRQ